MERWMNKLLALLVILIVMLVVVFVPFKIMACFKNLGRRGQVILARLNCFTGGIFLGTCFLFLLPEVSHLLSPSHTYPPLSLSTEETHLALNTHSSINHQSTLSSINHQSTLSSINHQSTLSSINHQSTLSSINHHPPHDEPSIYPYAQLVILAGFLAIMYLERAVHACRRRGEKVKVRSLSVATVANGDVHRASLKSSREEKKDGDDDDDDGKLYKHVEKELKEIHDGGGSNDDRVTALTNHHQQHQPLKEKLSRQVSVEIDDRVQDMRYRERGEVAGADVHEKNTTKAMILFIALTMDEVLGGLSMGLQRSSAGVWGMVVGLLAHEAVVGFSFGLQLASLANDKRCLAYTLGVLYALMTPIGAAVGLIISELTVLEHIDTINGVLQGLAAGVFLYVTFFEILEGEIHSQTPLPNIVCFTLGCAVMAAIAALPKTEDFTLEDVGGDNLTQSPFSEALSGLVT